MSVYLEKAKSATLVLWIRALSFKLSALNKLININQQMG